MDCIAGFLQHNSASCAAPDGGPKNLDKHHERAITDPYFPLPNQRLQRHPTFDCDKPNRPSGKAGVHFESGVIGRYDWRVDENPYQAPEAINQPPEKRQSLVLPSEPQKIPLLMFAFNLLLVGLGQIILGQTWKGIAILVGCAMVGALAHGSTLILAPIFGVIFGLDAYLIANKLKRGMPVGRWEFF